MKLFSKREICHGVPGVHGARLRPPEPRGQAKEAEPSEPLSSLRARSSEGRHQKLTPSKFWSPEKVGKAFGLGFQYRDFSLNPPKPVSKNAGNRQTMRSPGSLPVPCLHSGSTRSE